jgi:hypothetical protein
VKRECKSVNDNGNIGIGHAYTAAATCSNFDSHSHSYDASAALYSDHRLVKHRISDSRRYNTLKSLVHELDTLVHDHHGGNSAVGDKTKKCTTLNVLHEASKSNKKQQHEKETLAKAIQQLHHTDSDNDNDKDMNQYQYQYPYHSHSNESRARVRARTGSDTLTSLTLLEPSMSAFGIVLIKTRLSNGIRADVTDNIKEFIA